MKRDIGDIIKKSARDVSLTEMERERLERVVLGYMEMKPIGTRPPTRRRFEFSILHLRGIVALGLVVMLVASGSGVALAAEGTVPGDLLYPIKVSVNEEVRATLSRTDEARGAWEAQRAERRLEEAATLAARGKLSSDTKVQLAQKFEEHSEKAIIRVERSEEKDATFALGFATDFEARLKAQEEFLREVDDDERPLVENVRKKLDRLAQIRGRTQGRLALAPKSESLMETADAVSFSSVIEASAPEEDAREKSAPLSLGEPTYAPDYESEEQTRAVYRMRDTAHESIKRLESLLGKISKEGEREYEERVITRIEASRSRLNEGNAFLDSGNYVEAFNSYRAVVFESERIAVYLKGALELNLRRLPLQEPVYQPDEQGDPNTEEEEKSEIDDGNEFEDKDESR